MSYHAFGPDFLSEAVARHRSVMCPTPGCGGPGQRREPATIRYFPSGGVAEATIPAALYRCPDCGIKFAKEKTRWEP